MSNYVIISIIGRRCGDRMKVGKLKRLKKIPKIYYAVALLIIGMLVSVSIPSFARYKNRVIINDTPVWDGTIATSYKSGTGSKNDPFIISNGSELAYFSKMLEQTSYQNTYFRLTNDIILNNGVLKYEQPSNITYTINHQTKYIKEYTNEVYEDSAKTTLSTEKLNTFAPLANFKGHLDGNAYTIYGLYMASEDKEELGLFTNLQGEVSDLTVSNAIIYGGEKTGGIASTATSSTVKNISFDGYVIGKNTPLEKNEIVDISDQVVQVAPSINHEITIPLPENLQGLTTKTTISGTCTSDMTTGNLLINGIVVPECHNNTFELPLSTLTSKKLVLTLQDSDATTYTLTNLKYKIDYQLGTSAGLIANATNVTVENAINKSNVYSNAISSGLIAESYENITIKNTYNTGTLNSNLLSSGLIGKIENTTGNILISKSYNKGITNANLKAGIAGIINEQTPTITILDTFQTSSDYSIDTINNTPVSIINSYQTGGLSTRIGTSNGTFLTLPLENIKQNIEFPSYQGEENLNNNPEHVWIKDMQYPLLFIDNAKDAGVVINVGNYSWNNLSYQLKNYYYSSKITFNIKPKDDLLTNEECYYYISNKVLTQEEILSITTWTPFTEIMSLEEEGVYVIYAKEVNSNGTIRYLNTDQLILDKTPPVIEMRQDESKVWNSFTKKPTTSYISEPVTLQVTADDLLSKVKQIDYYISDKVLTEEVLANIEEEKWLSYQEKINLSEEKTSIIYIRAIDNALNKTYINSDYMIYGGYTQSKMYIGEKEITNLKEVKLTSTSKIAFQYQYEENSNFQEGDTHHIKVNIPLPEKTKITLIDHIKNKVYTYEVVEQTTSYPFSNFHEVGASPNTLMFQENHSEKINEDYKIVFDFENTNISTNYENIYTYLEILDKNKKVIRSTLKNTMKFFSLYKNTTETPYINSSINEPIIYNSDAIYEIPLQYGLLFSTYNNTKIESSTYQNKKVGLMIKLVNSTGKVMEKSHLKNIEWMIGEKRYTPDNEGVTRINLEQQEKEIQNFNTTLKLITKKANLKLDQDNYYFEISCYIAEDGLHPKTTSSEVVRIPIIYQKDYSLLPYNFNVIENKESKILKREEKPTALPFSILQRGQYQAPNIRISLYKKDMFTAYNQTYTKIDLKKYSTNTLELDKENTYYITKNPITYQDSNDTYNQFTLNLLTSKLSSGGYKLLFELYDGEIKVGEISNKFIVK